MTSPDPKPKKHTKRRKKLEITPSRIGLAAGAGALGLSTGFMNVSGWVAQGQDQTQKLLNGVMSGGMELLAASAFAWAGWQLSKGRWSRSAAAGVAGAAVVYFNTLATQNFLELQEHEARQAIEEAAKALVLSDAEIARLQTEVDSLIVQNGGTIPRPVDVIEASYAHLDPETNPINMGRKAAETGARREYDRLQGKMSALREASSTSAILANDYARTVIPPGQLPAFIWALQILQGTAFFLLGTNDLVFRAKKRKAQNPVSKAPSPATHSKKSSPTNDPDREAAALANRQKWAIVRGKGALAAQGRTNGPK